MATCHEPYQVPVYGRPEDLPPDPAYQQGGRTPGQPQLMAPAGLPQQIYPHQATYPAAAAQYPPPSAATQYPAVVGVPLTQQQQQQQQQKEEGEAKAKGPAETYPRGPDSV